MYKDTDNISENKHFSDYEQYITAKIEPQFNKTCLKRGGNGLKKRPAHLSIVERLGGN